MTRKTVISPDPTAIGEVSTPPFAVLPDPSRLFGVRAVRFRALAEANELAPYLWFLAGLADAQHAIIKELPEASPPGRGGDCPRARIPNAAARPRPY